ncbi:MAG TPA: CPBP family intramembrane glutamic endopeptidase, partial [Roseiflexaceae bacterium]|nr:CPBP family intramembrane glutamic endopeptidase [Roseiflexaceae bacterium]
MFHNLSNTTKAFLFFGLAFGLTLSVSLLQPLLGEATMFLHMFTPTAATLLMLLVFTREGYTRAGWSSLGLHRSGWRWWGLALLGPLAILTAVYGVVWMSGVGNPAMPQGFTPVSLLLELLATLVINTLFAIGEEIGFRGYLLPRLEHLGTTRALVLGGLMFGSWHFPLMLLTPVYPIHGSWLIVGPIVLVTLTAAGAFYGSLRLSSDSVWPATIAHGAINSYFKMFGLITVTSSPLLLEYLAGET